MLKLNSNSHGALVKKLFEALRTRNATISTAESCTGGMVATLLTHFPGSSALYLGGASVYSNDAKMTLLGVPKALIQEHGAVSKEVAESMAEGAKRVMGADYSVSITGIAGPDGGTIEKPVGLIWAGYSTPEGVHSRSYQLSGDRTENRAEISRFVLEHMIQSIQA